MRKWLLVCCCWWWACNVSAQYTLRLILKRAPEYNPCEAVFLAGNFNSWNPSDSIYRFQYLHRQWVLTLKDLPKAIYDFKLTRGSWATVECGKDGTDITNRALDLHADTTLYLTVEAWKDRFPVQPKKHTMSGNVQIMDTAFLMPQLNRDRRIWIYLPPGYGASDTHYPVLYLQDGQNLFDEATSAYGEWRVDETLDSFARRGYPGVIVVGVDNGGDKRLNEYNPYDNEKYGKGEGEAYVDFIVHTLKPFVDSHYRTLPEREHTGIGGSSMGGLISFYAALKYPSVFGKAGIFSPSFWIAPQLYKEVKDNPALKATRIYFVAGGMESDSMVPDMRRMYDLLLQKGVPSANMMTVVVPNGQHSESYWRIEFPNAYLWLFFPE